MKTNLILAAFAVACVGLAVPANAQNCGGCATGSYGGGAAHCQGYTQAEAEQLWAGYCGENCWGNPDQVDLPSRGCGLFGCHGPSSGCGGGFGGNRCGCRSSCGAGIGKLFGCRKGRGCRSRCGGGGSCFGWPGGSGTCGTPCGGACGSTGVVTTSAGCGGCGRCGKCLLGKFKRCLSGRIRCGGGAHAVGYTSSYESSYVGNACGAMNRAGYGSMGSCCGTGVVSNGCGCGNSVVSPTPQVLNHSQPAVPTPAEGNPPVDHKIEDGPKVDDQKPALEAPKSDPMPKTDSSDNGGK